MLVLVGLPAQSIMATMIVRVVDSKDSKVKGQDSFTPDSRIWGSMRYEV